MQTRKLTKADYDYIVSVMDRWWGGPAGERAHPVFFHELGELGLVAEENGERVGFLLGFLVPACEAEPETGYIHLVGIHPEHRRHGVGKELYAQFSARCRSHGAKRLKAITTVGNDGSLRFHMALGFTVFEDPNYAGEGRSRVVFTKPL